MRDHDPWVFAMLWETEHQRHVQDVAGRRRMRQVVGQPEARSRVGGGPPTGMTLGQHVLKVLRGTWPRSRRRARGSQVGS